MARMDMNMSSKNSRPRRLFTPATVLVCPACNQNSPVGIHNFVLHCDFVCCCPLMTCIALPCVLYFPALCDSLPCILMCTAMPYVGHCHAMMLLSTSLLLRFYCLAFCCALACPMMCTIVPCRTAARLCAPDHRGRHMVQARRGWQCTAKGRAVHEREHGKVHQRA